MEYNNWLQLLSTTADYISWTIYTEQKWKRYTWIVCMVSAKGNKTGNQSKMYIQVKD